MTAAIATQAPVANGNSEKPTLKAMVSSDYFRKQVASVLPKLCTPERFVRVALTAMMRSPKLQQCTQESFLNCLLRLAELGIEADGRRAHLIPFNKNTKMPNGQWVKALECQLIIDYKGLAELAIRSGCISYLHADIICENDAFKYSIGQIKEHEINFRQPRGKMYAVYAICKFKDGTEKAEVMTLDEVHAVRGRSKSKDDGPWITDFNEMAKKTVFRRMSKWLPLSPEQRDAVDADDDILPALLAAPANGNGTARNHRLEAALKSTEPEQSSFANTELEGITVVSQETPQLSAAEKMITPSWKELEEKFDITCFKDENGIAVQCASYGAILRPDGLWQEGYGGHTVTPNDPEHDEIARAMAVKYLNAGKAPAIPESKD